MEAEGEKIKDSETMCEPSRREAPETELPELADIEEAVKAHREALCCDSGSDTEPDADAQPRGAGQAGEGAPMRVGRYERERDLCDGAGLCSVGRWPPWKRPTVTDWRVVAIRSAIRRAVLQTVDREEGGLNGLFGKIAGGQFKESPFDEALKTGLAEYAVKLFADDGVGGAAPRRGDLEQPVRVRLIQALQRAIGDPDVGAMEHFARGIRLGVGVRLPRTPAVYGRKTRWRLPEQATADHDQPVDNAVAWRENYRSAKLCAEAVRKQLEDHHARGIALKLDPEEAKQRFPGLRVSSLGAVAKVSEDGGEPSVRLVLDGSHGVDINTSI